MRIATYLSVALIAGLYAFGSWAMSAATGPDRIVEASRLHSTDLIFNLAETRLGSGIVDVGRALFVTSVLAAMVTLLVNSGGNRGPTGVARLSWILWSA